MGVLLSACNESAAVHDDEACSDCEIHGIVEDEGASLD